MQGHLSLVGGTFRRSCSHDLKRPRGTVTMRFSTRPSVPVPQWREPGSDRLCPPVRRSRRGHRSRRTLPTPMTQRGLENQWASPSAPGRTADSPCRASPRAASSPSRRTRPAKSSWRAPPKWSRLLGTIQETWSKASVASTTSKWSGPQSSANRPWNHRARRAGQPYVRGRSHVQAGTRTFSLHIEPVAPLVATTGPRCNRAPRPSSATSVRLAQQFSLSPSLEAGSLPSNRRCRGHYDNQ